MFKNIQIHSELNAIFVGFETNLVGFRRATEYCDRTEKSSGRAVQWFAVDFTPVKEQFGISFYFGNNFAACCGFVYFLLNDSHPRIIGFTKMIPIFADFFKAQIRSRIFVPSNIISHVASPIAISNVKLTGRGPKD